MFTQVHKKKCLKKIAAELESFQPVDINVIKLKRQQKLINLNFKKNSKQFNKKLQNCSIINRRLQSKIQTKTIYKSSNKLPL